MALDLGLWASGPVKNLPWRPPLAAHAMKSRRTASETTLRRSLETVWGRAATNESHLASRGWPRTGRLGTPTRLPRWGPRPAGRGGVARDKRFSPSTLGPHRAGFARWGGS